MSAGSVTAYLSPTMARNFAINSGDSSGVLDCTIFISKFQSASDSGAAQPVIDGFTQSFLGDRHHRNGPRARCVERAKIAEKIGGGLIEIAARRQIHDGGGFV